MEHLERHAKCMVFIEVGLSAAMRLSKNIIIRFECDCYINCDPGKHVNPAGRCFKGFSISGIIRIFTKLKFPLYGGKTIMV